MSLWGMPILPNPSSPRASGSCHVVGKIPFSSSYYVLRIGKPLASVDLYPQPLLQVTVAVRLVFTKALLVGQLGPRLLFCRCLLHALFLLLEAGCRWQQGLRPVVLKHQNHLEGLLKHSWLACILSIYDPNPERGPEQGHF